MTGGGEKWTKIYAAFRAGATLRAICKRFRVSMGELLEQMRKDGWKRASDDGEKSAGPKKTALVLSEPVREEVNRLVDETLADILGQHKQIARQLRAHYEEELAEFQEMRTYMASFLDATTIAKLEAEPDDGKSLRTYLQTALGAFAKRMDVLAKLTQIGGSVIDRERLVLGVKLDDADKPAESFEDLLLEIERTKVRPREIPAEIIDFEKKLAARRES